MIFFLLHMGTAEAVAQVEDQSAGGNWYKTRKPIVRGKHRYEEEYERVFGPRFVPETPSGPVEPPILFETDDADEFIDSIQKVAEETEQSAKQLLTKIKLEVVLIEKKRQIVAENNAIIKYLLLAA